MPSPLFLLLFSISYFTLAHSESQHPYLELIETPYFVDKSELLVILFENFSYAHNYFTAPRHYGSTANLQMIDLFANMELDSSWQPINYTETVSFQIFNMTKFGRSEKNRYILDGHAAQHPVIYLNLGTHLPKNFSVQSMVKYLLRALQKAYERYEWLLKLPESRWDCGADRVINQEDMTYFNNLLKSRVNQAGVEDGLKTLSRILYKYFDRKVVILVDSFDHAFNYALFYSRAEVKSTSDMFEAFKVLSRMISNAIQYPYTISFMTGLSEAALDVDENLGGVSHFNFLDYHRFLGYFGYTEDEVDRILVKNRCPMPERNGVVRYYNGHRVIDGETKLFSPYSITKYLEHRLNDSEFFEAGLKPYFFGSERTSAIMKFIPIPVFRHHLIMLINRIPIGFCPVINFNKIHFEHYFLLRNNNFTFASGYSESFTESLLLTMILKMGYLCYDSDRNFILPNSEIEDYLRNALDTFYAPENETIYEIGSLIYSIMDAENQDQKDNQIRDLESKMGEFFTRLSTVHDYKRINELEYKYVTHKAIKKYQKDTHNKGNIWSSGGHLDTILITSKANNRTTAGVLQMSCNTTADDALAKSMKNIRPKVGEAPVTYIGISIDSEVNVKIETATVTG